MSRNRLSLVVGWIAGSSFTSAFAGVHVVAPSGLGPIPGSGVLETDRRIPLQGAGFQAHRRHLQTFTRDSFGAKTLGSFAVVTVVNAAY